MCLLEQSFWTVARVQAQVYLRCVGKISSKSMADDWYGMVVVWVVLKWVLKENIFT